jgi:hypothetical protein
MSITAYPSGQTDVTTYWIAYNNTTGARRTDIVFNTTSLTIQHIRNRTAEAQAVTGGGTAPVTLAADDTAHTDWGFRHIAGGVYRVDFPDAAFATGVDFVILDVFGPTDTVFAACPGSIDILGANPRAARIAADMERIAGQTVNASGAVTFPGTVASTTNITAATGVTLAAVVHTGATIPTVTTVTTTTNLTNAPTAGDLTATMKASVNAEVVDVLRTDTVAELSAVPAANAPLSAKIGWLFMKARNAITQTATTQAVKADDGTTNVATATVSDNGTTATRGEFT